MKKRVISLGKRTVSIFAGSDAAVYAGHATLSLITAVFPLIMLIISLLNMLPWYSPQDFTDLVFRFLPDLPQVKSLFLNVVTSLRTQSTGLLASVAALTALWSASAGVTAIQKGLKRITPGAEKRIWDKPVALLCTLLIIVLIPAFLVFNLLGDSLVDLLHSFSAAFGFEEITAKIKKAAKQPVIMKLTPIPGAVFTSLGWLVFTELFTRFVPLFWKSSVYGSLASLFLTITWVKVSVMILFLGDALNAAWKEEHA